MQEKQNKLTRKFGPFMSVCAIVGVVIGSGIYFRNEDVLSAVGGNLGLGIIAWAIGGFIMLSFAYSFAVLATRHEKVNGPVDFGEALVGKKYGYFLGWYMGMVYIPAIVAIMSWVSARFTAELFGWDNVFAGGHTMLLAGFFMVAIYVMNVLSHKITQKFHISSTVIKLIPLILMAVVGTIVGLVRGTTAENVGAVVGEVAGNPFFLALVATSFAYDGWWVVSSLNSEIKNSKKVLPFAMVLGGLIVIVVYILYFIGVFSSYPIENLVGAEGIRGAFRGIFGGVGGTLLLVFIVISCLGTLNGITMANQRSMYSLSMRNRGPNPRMFSQVDKVTNNPHNSSAIALLVSAVILVLVGGNFLGWFGRNIDIPGLSSIFFWLMLIPIFLFMMIKQKDLHWFNRFVAPGIAIAGACFMVGAAIYTHGFNVVIFTIAAVIIMGIGALIILLQRGKYNLQPAQETGEETAQAVEAAESEEEITETI